MLNGAVPSRAHGSPLIPMATNPLGLVAVTPMDWATDHHIKLIAAPVSSRAVSRRPFTFKENTTVGDGGRSGIGGGCPGLIGTEGKFKLAMVIVATIEAPGT